MVPMRKIFEALGAEVEWFEDTKTIIAVKDEITITMQIDNLSIKVNEEEIILDVPPQLVESRTLVPVRAVAEGLDADVKWNDETQTVIITKEESDTTSVSASVPTVYPDSAEASNLNGNITAIDLDENSINGFEKLWDTDFDDIWKMQNESDFLIAMNGWLCKKCNYGDNIEKLSYAERVFYTVFQLEGEVNNGGFSQYLYNSSGDFANEIVKALCEIKAYKTADICDAALTALGSEIPENWELRQEKLESMITDEVGEILDEYDNEFYSCSDNLEELSYKFIITNKSQFTHN